MSGVMLPDSRSRQKRVADALISTTMVSLVCLWALWFYGWSVCFLMLFGEEALGIPVVDLVAPYYFMVTMVSGGLLAMLYYSPSLNEWCSESKRMNVPLFVLGGVVLTSFLGVFVFAWVWTSEPRESRE